MNIEISDNRIAKNIPVAPENVEISLSTTEEHTEPLEINGMKIEGTFTVTKNLGRTTLKDLDAELVGIQERLSGAQQSVIDLTAELAAKQALRDQASASVTDAIATQVLPDSKPAEIITP